MGVSEGIKYHVYLRFHLGKNTNVFPIGERAYPQPIIGQKCYLPHQQDAFYQDMPQPIIEEITPNPLVGEPPRLYIGINLSENQDGVTLHGVLASLFKWYQNESQNLAQRDFSFSNHSFEQTYGQVPAGNYRQIVRSAVQKMNCQQARETLLNTTDLSERCQTNQRGPMPNANSLRSLQNKVGGPCA
ncbi:MAG: hypothetical protein AABY00_01085 [Nanoarchaeota archaeon]